MPEEPRKSRWGWGALFVAGVLVGTGGGYVARRPPAEETRFLNFDVESTAQDLRAEGWSTFEALSSGDTFAWCMHKSCSLELEMHAPSDRVVRLRAFPFWFGGAPPQSAAVTLNGAHVADLAFPGAPTVLSFGTESRSWKPGTNVLRFDFAYAERPRDHDPKNPDARTLSAAVDWLEVVRR